MGFLDDFGAKLGFGQQQSDLAAQDDLQTAKDAYTNLTPPELTQEHPDFASASDQGPSQMGAVAVNPAYASSQMDQLAALSNLAKNGGRNAASDANLARIQQNELANSKGQRDAVMANANARGVGGGGAALVAQLAGNQAAQSNANANDMAEAGNEATTGINAGASAANIGSNLQNQDFNEQASKATAQDAINRFNASNRTGMSQYNTGIANDAQKYNTGLQQTGYQNQYQKAAGVAGSNMAGVNYNQAQSNMGAQQAGNLLAGGAKLGAAMFGAASGGEIPGTPAVKGDSTLNDFMSAHNTGGPNLNVSPKEVVVPVSLRTNGTKNQIANFVRNPPKIGSPNNKEAMLSALQNIRRRGGI